MATVNFSVPEDVKASFNRAFKGRNKSAVITELMREAVDRVRRRQESRAAVERILTRRRAAPFAGGDELRKIRDAERP